MRQVNKQFAENSNAIRHSTLTIASTKKQKTKDFRLRKFGKDIQFIKQAFKAIGSYPSACLSQKRLLLVLLKELGHIDLLQSESIWNKILRTFHNQSDRILKQMLLIFLSNFLRMFYQFKILDIEMKKNMSKNSNFNFRLVHSVSFNEENEVKAVKTHIVEKIQHMFQKILKTNFDDDTLMLAILQLGQVGDFSEDITRLCLRRMMDLDLMHNLMILSHLFLAKNYLTKNILSDSPKESMNTFTFDYHLLVDSDFFSNNDSFIRMSQIKVLPTEENRGFKLTGIQTINGSAVDSQKDGIPHELVCSNLVHSGKKKESGNFSRMGMSLHSKLPRRLKLSTDNLKKSNIEGTSILFF